MKASLFAVLLCLSFHSATAQLGWEYVQGWISFEDDNDSLVHILPSADSSFLWQIGQPNKSTFNVAGTPPNAIVTDTANPYPVGVVSQFLVVTGFGWEYASLSFNYYVDTDTLNDFGSIEVSFQGDTTWYNLLNEPAVIWNQLNTGEKPVFSGTPTYWQHAHANLSSLLPATLQEGDTILFRFTFRSDSVFDDKDGLMFDDISYFHWYSSVPAVTQTMVSSRPIPNPVSIPEPLHLQTSIESGTVSVFDALGRKTYEANFTGNAVISTKSFNSGLYSYRLLDRHADKTSTGNFIINHR